MKSLKLIIILFFFFILSNIYYLMYTTSKNFYNSFNCIYIYICKLSYIPILRAIGPKFCKIPDYSLDIIDC